jgi:hypothetical protein
LGSGLRVSDESSIPHDQPLLIDMTLAVIARLAGVDVAERIAVRMEYEWHRDAGWDPFARVHGLV